MRLLQLLFSFRGRVSRTGYWLGHLTIILFIFIFLLALFHVTNEFENEVSHPAVQPASMALDLLLYIPATALIVKRGHDHGLSSFWGYAFGLVFASLTLIDHLLFPQNEITEDSFLWFTVPYLLVEMVIIIGAGLFRGTKGNNPYGPDPLAHKAARSTG